jgi:hypothetical protein
MTIIELEFHLRVPRPSRVFVLAQNAEKKMFDLSSAGNIGRVRIVERRRWRREAENPFSLITRQHRDPFLISAPNLSRNRIEQQGGFGIFSKESFSRTAPASLKAMNILSPEKCFGVRHVVLCCPGHSIE